jgi:hypothetical protein
MKQSGRRGAFCQSCGGSPDFAGLIDLLRGTTAIAGSGCVRCTILLGLSVVWGPCTAGGGCLPHWPLMVATILVMTCSFDTLWTSVLLQGWKVPYRNASMQLAGK